MLGRKKQKGLTIPVYDDRRHEPRVLPDLTTTRENYIRMMADRYASFGTPLTADQAASLTQGQMEEPVRKKPMHAFKPGVLLGSPPVTACWTCGDPASAKQHRVPDAVDRPVLEDWAIGERVSVRLLTDPAALGYVVGMERTRGVAMPGLTSADVMMVEVQLDDDPGDPYRARVDQLSRVVPVPKFTSIAEADAWMEEQASGQTRRPGTAEANAAANPSPLNIPPSIFGAGLVSNPSSSANNPLANFLLSNVAVAIASNPTAVLITISGDRIPADEVKTQPASAGHAKSDVLLFYKGVPTEIVAVDFVTATGTFHHALPSPVSASAGDTLLFGVDITLTT